MNARRHATLGSLQEMTDADLARHIGEVSAEWARRCAAGKPPLEAAADDAASTRAHDAGIGSYIRQRELLANLGVSRATLWSWRQKGLFPEPISLGPQVVAWRSSDVAAWRRRRGI